MEWTFGPGVSSSSALLSWESKSIAGIFGGEGSPYSKRAALQGLSPSAASLFFPGLGGAADDAAGAPGGAFGGASAGASAGDSALGDPMCLCTSLICFGAFLNAKITALTGSLKRLPVVACMPLAWQ